MTTLVAAPHRFRRRLTIAFVLIAAVTGGLVAAVSLLLMDGYRSRAFLQRAGESAELNAALAPADVSLENLPSLLRVLREQGSFETVAVVDGAIASSSSEIDLSAVPSAVLEGRVDETEVEVAGRSYLLLAAPVRDPGAQLYFFYPRDVLEASLAEDRQIVLLVWLAVTAAAAAAGALIARRTLAPVTRAASAARSLSEGLLDTRLEADRQDEFGLWADSFNTMATALEQKIDDLAAARDRERQFTADVAHDLRTPVTALVAEAELLHAHADELPASARRLSELLHGDVTRLVALVEDLLELAALDGGRAEVVVESVALDEIVRDVVEAVAASVDVDLSLAPVVVDTDARRVRRILSNLVANAVHHGGSGVAVRLSKDGGDVLLSVADAGTGIAPEHLPLVFDRFYRADAARTGGGSGLGLAIAKEDALLLGGDLTASSVPGRGALFTLCLPGAGRRDGPPTDRSDVAGG